MVGGRRGRGSVSRRRCVFRAPMWRRSHAECGDCRTERQCCRRQRAGSCVALRRRGGCERRHRRSCPRSERKRRNHRRPGGRNIECQGRWRDPLRRICADHGCFHIERFRFHIECSRSCADQGCFHIERSRISVEHVHLCADHGSRARTGAHEQCGTNRPRSDARRLWQRPSAQRPTRFPLR